MVFLPQEVIAHKRDGNSLSRDEIKRFISGFAAGTVTHAQAAAFAMAVYFNDMDLDERVALTEAMRDSGSVLDWSDLDGPVIDKHSTGGIGDNTSLMLAPILAACGVFVPMISGRGLGHTGGTLDKFDAIPGYKTNPDNDLFRKTVKEVGCAIIGQTDDLAPADRTLYAIRDVDGDGREYLADHRLDPFQKARRRAAGARSRRQDRHRRFHEDARGLARAGRVAGQGRQWCRCEDWRPDHGHERTAGQRRRQRS